MKFFLIISRITCLPHLVRRTYSDLSFSHILDHLELYSNMPNREKRATNRIDRYNHAKNVDWKSKKELAEQQANSDAYYKEGQKKQQNHGSGPSDKKEKVEEKPGSEEWFASWAQDLEDAMGRLNVKDERDPKLRKRPSGRSLGN